MPLRTSGRAQGAGTPRFSLRFHQRNYITTLFKAMQHSGESNCSSGVPKVRHRVTIRQVAYNTKGFMATFSNRKGRVKATVRVTGFKQYNRTFGGMEEAKSWASEIEASLKSRRAKHKGKGFSGDVYDLNHSPLTLEEILMLPRYKLDESAIGIYFLIKRNVVVYVGQSRQVHWRVREHKTQRNGEKDFDSYCWIAVSPEKLDETELRYIELLRPRLNHLGSPIVKLERKIASRRISRIEKRALLAELSKIKSVCPAKIPSVTPISLHDTR